ncbi:hypothetical protein KTT_09810 [Tengunoibacter tsumagoiensis]|uniref:HTH merR-type domain-containing protein n=1 Tax=Tengunoibacter tsumagoiensis TaxID=2014871 RepID=A0A401ZWE2_9CHLR|nr:hypothetical protein KTT_09810 [Tengunoibacter tsumagoiensis]
MGLHEALYRPLSRKERSIGTRNTVTVVQSDVQPQSLRIDDLAYLANVPSRTIRFYNTQDTLISIMHRRLVYQDS